MRDSNHLRTRSGVVLKALRHGCRRTPALARTVLVAGALAAGAVASVDLAHADWLVLSTGEEVETKGPWKTQGRTIVFTSTRGVLSSVRTSSVDLDASVELTRKKKEQAEAKPVEVAPPPRQAPVLVLTDADFTPAPGTASAATAAGATAGESDTGEAASQESVVVPAADALETRTARQLAGAPNMQVMNWSARPTGEDEISILGYVRNQGKTAAAAVSVTVTLVDTEGTVIGSKEASLSTSAIMPGVQAFFEAEFPTSPTFSRVDFAVRTVELEIRREDGGEPDAESEGGPENEPDNRGDTSIEVAPGVLREEAAEGTESRNPGSV